MRQVKTVKLIDAPPVQMITDQMSMLTGVIGPPNLPISRAPMPFRYLRCAAFVADRLLVPPLLHSGPMHEHPE